MNTYYPVNIQMQDQPCVVIGGGKIAEGKVDGLLVVEANVTVISPDLTSHLQELAAQNRIRHISRFINRAISWGIYGDLCYRPARD